MTTTHRRDLRIEAHFLPETVDDLAALRTAVLELGEPEQVAHGIVGWLVAKGAGERYSLSAQTRSNYRKVLAELVERHPDGPLPQHRRNDRGFAELRQLLGLGAAATTGAVMAATGHPVLALVAAPIIHDAEGYVDVLEAV